MTPVQGRPKDLHPIALTRGWPDEAAARVTNLLSRFPKPPGALAPIAASARLLRAQARAMEGRAALALADADAAVAVRSHPDTEAAASRIRTEVYLLQGDVDGALRESENAIRRLPSSLWNRYWRGRALLAGPSREEGLTMLKDLAASFPREHWGMEAGKEVGRAGGM